MQDKTKLEVEGGELLIKSSKGVMAVIPKEKVGFVKDLIERKNYKVLDNYVQTLQVLKRNGGVAEDGIVIDPPVKPIAPAESTGNVAPAIARMNYRLAQKQAQKEKEYQEAIADKTGMAEEYFVKKYNTSPHRYKYDSDPQYRKEVDKRAEETSKKFGSIDLPATDVNSRNYAGNPNLAFMTQRGMSKEGRKALEQSNLEIIGAALPIPGIETVGKLPSLTKLGGKILQRAKAKPVEEMLGSVSDKPKKSFQDLMNDLTQFKENDPANITLEEFKTRIQTPEGKRRMLDLGITKDRLLQEIKLIKDYDTHGVFNPNQNTISLTPYSPLPKTITRHEIEHAVQNARIKSFKVPIEEDDYWEKLSDIDISLNDLDIKWDLQKSPQNIKISDLGQIKGQGIKNPNVEVLESMLDDPRAQGYFISGSGGREKSAFLAEVQQHMLNTGLIKDPYQKITVNDVKKAYDLNTGKYSERKFLRLFNIMEPSEKNFSLIAENLNKMLSLTGAAAGGVGSYKSQEKNEK